MKLPPRALAAWLGVTALAAAALWWRKPLLAWSLDLVAHVRAAGGWGPVWLALAYIPACVLLLPGSILTLGAGFAFGLWRGTLAVSLGSTLGATVAFWLGRTLLRDSVERRFADNVRFQRLRRAVEERGATIVLLARLSPVLPFNLMNYALGLTSIRLRDYVWASWLGMLPGTVMFVYLGTAVGDLADLTSGRRERSHLELAFFVVGLLCTIGTAWYVARLAKNSMGQTDGDAPAKDDRSR